VINPLQTLVEQDAICKLKALYFYHLDHKNWDEWSSLFVSDARFTIDRGTSAGGKAHSERLEGLAAIVKFVKDSVQTANTVHHGHMPLISLQSENEASGIWAMADIVDYGSDNVLHGYGHYHETYRRIDGAWKFNSIHLTRLRIEIAPRR
jgi:hypothetical protein